MKICLMLTFNEIFLDLNIHLSISIVNEKVYEYYFYFWMVAFSEISCFPFLKMLI